MTSMMKELNEIANEQAKNDNRTKFEVLTKMFKEARSSGVSEAMDALKKLLEENKES